METTDRYEALGMLMPVPWTACKGGCEGIGVHPMRFESWEAAKDRPKLCPQIDEEGRWELFPPEDGYVFVYCSRCGGSGLRMPRLLARILGTLYGFYYPISWIWVRQQVRFDDESWWDAAKNTPHMIRFVWREYAGHRRMLRTR